MDLTSCLIQVPDGAPEFNSMTCASIATIERQPNIVVDHEELAASGSR
jgi:hypothetical protein